VSQKKEAPIDWGCVDAGSSFKNKTMTEVDFSGRVLVGVDFSGSTLVRCNFNNCDLSHANFEGTDLYRSTFSGSVLYATRFGDCNLTRCDFCDAFIYGLRIVEFANVTYANFAEFRLEARRRQSKFATHSDGYLELKLGQRVNDTATLANSNYFVNGILFMFTPFDGVECHMQHSQIYNRLKRLYLTNAFNEEARHCLYKERYHRTRSWYREYTFSGKVIEGEFRVPLRRLFQTLTARLFEELAGYGLKPSIVVRNMTVLYALYVAIVMFMLWQRSASGLLFEVASISRQHSAATITQSTVDLGCGDVAKVLYFCGFSMFSLTFQNFSPYGNLVWISSLFGLAGLSLLALLITALFSVLRND
jgi:uncharacterized protein YjbI with pentapeptide repeats